MDAAALGAVRRGVLLRVFGHLRAGGQGRAAGLVQLYARCILFDYCYKYFYNDGDGKVDTADLDCYRCRLAATGISGGATVAAGQPLALTLQLDPAQGPLTYAWSDQGATDGDRDLRWPTPGTYTVTASVTHRCRTASASLGLR